MTKELKKTIATIILTIICVVSMIVSMRKAQIYDLSQYLSAVSRALTLSYYFNNNEQIINSIELGLESKDPYLRLFYTDQDFNNAFSTISDSDSKRYGFYFDTKTGKILSVLKHSPNRNILKIGDQILEINGEKNKKEFLTILRKKDHVNIKIKRKNKILNLKLVAKKIEPVYLDINNDQATITIYFFNLKTVPDLYNELKRLKELIKEKKIDKLIIDVSQNPGGSVSVLSTCLSYFIDKGKLLFYEKRKNQEIKYFSTSDKLIDLNQFKIVEILKSHRTASSAEIFLGCLKYYYPKIKLIGPKTYGKWTTIRFIKFFHGGMLLSIGRIYLPNGKTYESIGI